MDSPEKNEQNSRKFKTPLSVRETALIGLLAAILLLVQVSLSFLPNIELISLLVILYTIHFRKQSLYIIYVFVLLEGLVFGFGMWWFSYLYIWAALSLAVRFIGKQDSVLWYAIISAFFGLLFGTLSSIPNFLIYGFYGGITYIISGIPFDLLHCGGNFLAALLLFHPLNHLLKRLSQASGL